jgi:hypothetical protein
MSDFFETTATPETKQEITMSAHNLKTLKGKIGAYKDANPTASIADIAKVFRTSKPYVYQCLNNYVKPKRIKAVAKKVVERNEQGPTVNQLNNKIQSLSDEIVVLRGVVDALKRQNRGLDNVITYLESKLGIDEIDARLEATKG